MTNNDQTPVQGGATEEQIEAAKFEVEHKHQIHGDTCVCGFQSARARSRTEHITNEFVAALSVSASADPADEHHDAEELHLVTIKLPPRSEHNPREKVTAPCAVSEMCTDETGEHHTLVARTEAEVEAIREKFGHITRVETVRVGATLPSRDEDHDTADEVRRAVRLWAQRFRLGDVWDPQDAHDLEAALSCVVESAPTAHDRRRAESEDHAATVTPIMQCSDGLCPSGCSHLMWSCAKCSCEGGWGAEREKLEALSAAHVCPEPEEIPATVTGDREQLIAEARDWARYDATGASKIVIALCDALDTPANRAATVTGDREKLIEQLRDWADRDWRFMHNDYARTLRQAAAALSDPVEVDEAKLAEVIRSVPRVMVEIHSRLTSRNPTPEEVAAAVAAHIRCEGQ